MSSAGEIYQHGHHTSVVSNHAKRTAETDAAFFLPYLKPGMRLRDVGCGPGSITVGLALRVEPGPTVGMDASGSVIETARSLVKNKPARYLTFEVGNIYEPHFPAENFDAIFAHQVLQHCVDQSTRYGNSGRFWHLAGSSVFVMLIGEAQRFIRRTKEFAAS